MVTLKSCYLIGRSRILERVQLDVREVTRPSFSRRLKGVVCETSRHGVVLPMHGLQFHCWYPIASPPACIVFSYPLLQCSSCLFYSIAYHTLCKGSQCTLLLLLEVRGGSLHSDQGFSEGVGCRLQHVAISIYTNIPHVHINIVESVVTEMTNS